MNQVRIIIADDHTIFRQGLTALLANEPGIEITGEAQNGYEVMALVRTKDIDVVLMDVEMPGKDGLETTRVLKKEHPKIRVLALTMHHNPAFVKQMLKAGANGYILKDADKDEVVKAIEKVMEGKSYYSPKVARSVMESLSPKNNASVYLSERELEIIQLISNQLTSQQIAKKLHLSLLTVETHRKNILLKLGVSNMAGLVKLAYKKGWIE